MEQTFIDLYQEKHQVQRGLISFTILAFAETAVGIAHEHIAVIREPDTMKNFLVNLKVPATISFALVLPFMILELVNRRNFNFDFPIVLFVLMWLLPLIFITLATPLVQNLRIGTSLLANPAGTLIRVALMSVIVWLWLSLVADQMPCFLGVPNCD